MRTIFLQAWLAVGMLIGSLCASAQMPKIQRAEIKVPEAK